MDLPSAVSIYTDQKTGAVYTDDLMKFTGRSREAVTRYLKEQGYRKSAGCTSRRWVKDAA